MLLEAVFLSLPTMACSLRPHPLLRMVVPVAVRGFSAASSVPRSRAKIVERSSSDIGGIAGASLKPLLRWLYIDNIKAGTSVGNFKRYIEDSFKLKSFQYFSLDGTPLLRLVCVNVISLPFSTHPWISSLRRTQFRSEAAEL